MKVAITGASGHIGNCLTRILIDQGAKVKTLVHKIDHDLKDLDVEIIRGDLLNPQSLDVLCKDVDFVFHLAARISIDKKDTDLVYRTNVNGTQNLVNACRKAKVKRMIHFSSIHAFQMHPLNEVLDETRPLVDNTGVVYESSKAEGERIVLRAVQDGLDALIINPTAVVGPYDYTRSYLGQALIKIYLNKLPMLVPGGYDWVDVRDVVQGTLSALKKGRKGERYLLSGHYHSLRELSQMVSRISGKKTPVLEVPMFIARIGSPFIQLYASLRNEHPLYTRESLDILVNSPKNISNARARKELGYTSLPLEETLRDTFAWYAQNNFIPS